MSTTSAESSPFRSRRPRGVVYRVLLEISLAMVFVMAMHYATDVSRSDPAEVRHEPRTQTKQGLRVKRLAVVIDASGIQLDGNPASIPEIVKAARSRQIAFISLNPTAEARFGQIEPLWRELVDAGFEVQFGI